MLRRTARHLSGSLTLVPRLVFQPRALSMATSNGAAKRKQKTIGTHSGSFHCDEALGCFLLRQTEEYRDAEIVRSRDPAVLKDLDVVIDVGGEYDPAAQRFDHHQRGFDEIFGHGFTTKLSSAGLVYRHFGRGIVAAALGRGEADPDVTAVFLAVYRYFVHALDAVDNGVDQFPGAGEPRYESRTDLPARVGGLNPPWNGDQSAGAVDAQFRRAVALTGAEFLESVRYHGQVWLPARAHVKAAVEARHSVHASGEIIRLDVVCPWKAHLYALEEELGVKPPLKFVLYEDTRERKWRVQAVSVGPGSFENRRSLPAAWRGLRDEELARVAGVPGAVFCHASGFIGGAATFDGVLAMAAKALAES